MNIFSTKIKFKNYFTYSEKVEIYKKEKKTGKKEDLIFLKFL